MKYFQAGTLLFLAGLPAPIFAENFLPTAQDKYFEIGAEIIQQEATGLRWSLAYLMNMGMPSFVSKIGLDLGFQFFEGVSPFALEYGFFLESTVHASASYTAHVKTGLYTLTFPEDEASQSSMSSVAIEPGVQWDRNGMFWEFGIGARYRDQDSERIAAGTQTIDKQWLFYPKLGLGTRF